MTLGRSLSRSLLHPIIAAVHFSLNIHSILSHSPSLNLPSPSLTLSSLSCILQETVRDLLTCAGMNILVLADDSSSMQAVSDTSDVYKPKTRWSELKDMLEKLATMMLVIDHAGFELKFFNDPEWFDIHTVADLEDLFKKKPTPKGMTPLAANLQLVLSSSYSRGGETSFSFEVTFATRF